MKIKNKGFKMKIYNVISNIKGEALIQYKWSPLIVVTPIALK